MKKQKTEWELRREAATKSWKSMTPHQQEAIMTLLKAWVPIRTHISELCSLDYDDLRKLDTAWYELRNALVDQAVTIKQWDY